MDIRLNDVLEMKKTHPCGEKRWQVLRTGMDFRLRCLGCGREVMTPRFLGNISLASSAVTLSNSTVPLPSSPCKARGKSRPCSTV